ncbi:MAG: 3-deoxy-D-manno-octulosonic acid kinase [Arenimonas sp.]|nr:3-deoxy-D-manno-octulosonic acid kinase [Arenimonas sp.]
MTENEHRTSSEHVRRPEGRVDIMFDAGRLPQITEQQFSPSGYADARPVSGQGGRGSAWFVQTPAGDGVLKHYLRGGLLAALVKDRYLYLGAAHTRSFREYQLLLKLCKLGLPVPKPLAAFCRRGLFTYQAALLTERLQDTHSLTAAVKHGSAPWAAIGETVARLHSDGAHHGDLNANNILLDRQGGIFIIDWDKSVLESSPGAWCGKVLERLQRSLLKECTDCDQRLLQDGIALMRSAYQKAMP